jgi:hypothetical protein
MTSPSCECFTTFGVHREATIMDEHSCTDDPEQHKTLIIKELNLTLLSFQSDIDDSCWPKSQPIEIDKVMKGNQRI